MTTKLTSDDINRLLTAIMAMQQHLARSDLIYHMSHAKDAYARLYTKLEAMLDEENGDHKE